MPTPQELRNEAAEADELAKLVSYAPDKQWLKDKAEALRHHAECQEKTSAGRLTTNPEPPRRE